MAEPERTGDGRYIVVNGRRWRATDPSIPEALEKELVSELMAARRAVRDAGDDTEERAARDRVQDAKVALGERGTPWWEEATDGQVAERATATIRALLRNRDEGSTICPSDAARVVGGESWRDRMDLVRATARQLARDRVTELRQGGEPVDLEAELSGPLRIGRGDRFAT